MNKRLQALLQYQNIALISMGLMLVACTHFPSVNTDPAKNNKAAFQKDLNECKEDYPESSAGLHYNRWRDCMHLKGWK